MFKIDKGIPVPTKSGRVPKYPWREMEVGDSFFVPGMTAASAAAGCLGAKKATGWTFRYRTVDGGARIWRVS